MVVQENHKRFQRTGELSAKVESESIGEQVPSLSLFDPVFVFELQVFCEQILATNPVGSILIYISSKVNFGFHRVGARAVFELVEHLEHCFVEVRLRFHLATLVCQVEHRVVEVLKVRLQHLELHLIDVSSPVSEYLRRQELLESLAQVVHWEGDEGHMLGRIKYHLKALHLHPLLRHQKRLLSHLDKHLSVVE